MGDESVGLQEAEDARPRLHWYAADIVWSDGAPPEMLSWTPIRCLCSDPSRHYHLL